MANKRIMFNDLFVLNNDILTLKRKLIIGSNSYEIGDVVDSGLPENPENFDYVINPLRIGDTLDSWVPKK